jgi:hypothetical protein
VRVLSRFFRRRFPDLLEQAFDRDELEFFSALEELRERESFRRYPDPLRKKEWIVYAKAPFADPDGDRCDSPARRLRQMPLP